MFKKTCILGNYQLKYTVCSFYILELKYCLKGKPKQEFNRMNFLETDREKDEELMRITS